MMLRDHHGSLSGMNAVVVGRSNIVGKPMAQLLLNDSCTVTIAHSRTKEIEALCREADILVAAVGRAEMVTGDWVKPGAITPVPGGVGPMTIACLLANTVTACSRVNGIAEPEGLTA